MKKKILLSLNYLWCTFIAFTFPFCFGWIWLDITGHSKGYGYDLGSEKDISILFGCVELFIYLMLAVPSNLILVLKLKQSSKLYQILTVCLFAVLMLICIQLTGGWSEYLEGVFNIK